MNRVLQEVRLAAYEAPRVYFAPLVGAVKEMRRQIQLLAEARRQTPIQKNENKDQRLRARPGREHYR